MSSAAESFRERVFYNKFNGKSRQFTYTVKLIRTYICMLNHNHNHYVIIITIITILNSNNDNNTK